MSASDGKADIVLIPKKYPAKPICRRPFSWRVLDFSHALAGASKSSFPPATAVICSVAYFLRHLWAARSIARGAARLRHGGFSASRHFSGRNVRGWLCHLARNLFGFFPAQYLD